MPRRDRTDGGGRGFRPFESEPEGARARRPPRRRPPRIRKGVELHERVAPDTQKAVITVTGVSMEIAKSHEGAWPGFAHPVALAVGDAYLEVMATTGVAGDLTDSQAAYLFRNVNVQLMSESPVASSQFHRS